MDDRLKLADELEHRIWDGFLAGAIFVASAHQFERGNDITGGIGMGVSILLFWLAHRLTAKQVSALRAEGE